MGLAKVKPKNGAGGWGAYGKLAAACGLSIVAMVGVKVLAPAATFAASPVPGAAWPDLVTDSLISLTYGLIFGSLVWIALRLRRIATFRNYLWIFAAFGTFVGACGATRLISIVSVWVPSHPLLAGLNVVCAALSIPTAILFARVTPTIAENIGRYLEMVSVTTLERDEALVALLASETLMAERREAEQALASANSRLRSFRLMVNSVSDYGVFLLDPEGIVQTWNLGAIRMKGYAPSEIIGRSFEAFYLPTAIGEEAPGNALLLAVAQGSHEEEGWRVRKDGSRLWASVTTTALRETDGALIGFGVVTRDLTERRNAEEALRASNEQKSGLVAELAGANAYLNNLLNASNFLSIIACNPEGIVTTFNRGAEEMLGYRAQEVVGKHSPALFHLAEEVAARGAMLGELHGRPIDGFDVFTNSIGNPDFDRLEWTYVHKDGHHLTVILSLHVVRDERGDFTGSLGIAENITERRAAEKALAAASLREAELVAEERRAGQALSAAYQQLNSVLECTSDSVMTIGRDWTILYGNRRTVEGLADFKIGENYWECFPAVIGSKSEAILRDGMEHRQEFRYESFYAPYGRWFKVQGYPTQDGLSIFFTDVTEEKKMQEQLALEQLLRERRIEALSHMAGGLAHEISNPLAIIHARASDLKSMSTEIVPLPAIEVDKACDSIVQTSDRAIRILRGLRGFAREGGNDPMEWASVDTIVEQCLDIQQSRYERHAVTLLVNCAPGLPLLLCREVQIVQILTNLLANAFDAVNQSNCPARWVSLAASSEGDCLCVDVVDSGPGIDNRFRANLMEPFFTTKSASLGMGVGLSLSKAIAQDHGGTLTLRDGTQNTTFRLVLPFSGNVAISPAYTLPATNGASHRTA